jgi:hypothetical protein
MIYQILLHRAPNTICNHMVQYIHGAISHDVIFWSSVFEAIVQFIQCKNKIEDPYLSTFSFEGYILFE